MKSGTFHGTNIANITAVKTHSASARAAQIQIRKRYFRPLERAKTTESAHRRDFIIANPYGHFNCKQIYFCIENDKSKPNEYLRVFSNSAGYSFCCHTP